MKKILTLLALFAMTLSVTAQTQKFYMWKNGAYVEHDISDVDSVTFSLYLPEYAVDLGLPSGTLWADRNVGAEGPDDYGDYFAWGETAPKSDYSWETYKWCKGSARSQTKYCSNTYYWASNYTQFPDKRTILVEEDDAAITNWGGEWIMPRKEDFAELINKCTWIWMITKNDVEGYKVIGPNGNSIFLPAVGHLDNGTVDVGSSGYYWSVSLDKDFESSAHGLCFGLRYYHCCGVSRYNGCTVRAVVK